MVQALETYRLLVKSISEAQRKRDPHAGPGESYPLDPEHLKAAWDLAGHAANPSAVRAKVLAYARAHGLMDHLPETARTHDDGEHHIMSKARANHVRELLRTAYFPYNALYGGSYDGDNGDVESPELARHRRRVIEYAQNTGIAQHLPDEAHGFMHMHNMPHMHDGEDNGFHTHEVTKAFNPLSKSFLISKAEPQEDGTVIFEGWLSTPAKDIERDVAEPEAFVGAMDSYFARSAPISNTHDRKPYPSGHLQKAVAVRDGQVLHEATHPTDGALFEHWDGTGTGVYVRGRVTEKRASDQIRKGNLGGLSYIANLKKYEPLPGGGRRFLELNPWIESTVAAYPINHEAVITVAKAFGLTDEQETQPNMGKTTEVPSLEEILAELGESLSKQEQTPAVTKAEMAEMFTALGEKLSAAFADSVQKASVFQRGEGTGRVGGQGQQGNPREDDPAAYIVSKAQEVEDAGKELDPSDKDLAYGLFYASMFTPVKKAGGAVDDDE